MSMRRVSRAVRSVAYKEFLHIWRDWRIMVLVLTLPPVMTLMFGHAFEVTALTNARTILQDNDATAGSKRFTGLISQKDTFAWRYWPAGNTAAPDLLVENVSGVLTIPAGWEEGLRSGKPVPLRLVLDGTDTATADQLRGAVRQALGEFQTNSRDLMIESLPDPVIEMGENLPVEVRKQFVSWMEPWDVESTVLYNPRERFIDYVMPGIIGLILQLLTVTLMASTIARERESGTLSQLMVTSLRRGEIVVGKVVPYLVLSIFLILTTVAVGRFHFDVEFHRPLVLGVICLLFLLCSLGLGLLISSFCNTQTQAIQIAVFYLLPVFPLSGAFAPLERLPAAIQVIAKTFPLTHFCHAFRMINLRDAAVSYIAQDLVFLAAGAVLTCLGAALLLRRAQD